ncbi:MAG: serine/threonine-protein phosphatase [Treponema sp.]|jgi:serine/threonine protein phosphatase PrpC|nr:serine/threonine-protein phosphatase [Treponema sp.]
MKIAAGAYSSRGSVRAHNEDAFLIARISGGGGVEDSSAEFAGEIDASLFFCAADGMGGHAAGDAASAFVVENLRADETSPERVHTPQSLEALVKTIHAALIREGAARGTPNMGSTLTGILLQKDAPCGFFNAGDSRSYRLRNGFMQQLTRDDSLSSIVPEAAKNIITNAVGAGLSGVTVTSRFSPSVAIVGDVFLMCSDGVHGFVGDDDLEKMLAEDAPPGETARRIVEAAIANNSDDNCTAVVVKIEGDP